MRNKISLSQFLPTQQDQCSSGWWWTGGQSLDIFPPKLRYLQHYCSCVYSLSQYTYHHHSSTGQRQNVHLRGRYTDCCYTVFFKSAKLLIIISLMVAQHYHPTPRIHSTALLLYLTHSVWSLYCYCGLLAVFFTFNTLRKSYKMENKQCFQIQQHLQLLNLSIWDIRMQ